MSVKAEEMRSQADVFRKTARETKLHFCWQHYKMILLLVVILIVIGVVIWFVIIRFFKAIVNVVVVVFFLLNQSKLFSHVSSHAVFRLIITGGKTKGE